MASVRWAHDEASRRVRKLSFGHDISVIRVGAAQAECAFIDVAQM
jgi:hypothetical protein